MARSVSTLVRHQRSALTALVDAAVMERAVDHQWMGATYDAWSRLAVACTRQHQVEEARGAPVAVDPEARSAACRQRWQPKEEPLKLTL